MTIRAERAVEAARLRAGGLLLDEIAERLGISRSYASELVDDPTGAKVRARKNSYRGTCSICGSRTSGSDGPKAAATLCAPCTQQRQSEEKRWTRDAIVAAIRDWASEHGRPPTATDWRTADPDGRYPAASTVYNQETGEFSFWGEAIEAAGFLRPRQGQRPGDRHWSRELVLSELRRLAVDGVAPSVNEAPGLWQAARRYAGGWYEAIAEAGLQPRPISEPYWTAERIVEELRRISVDGVAPTMRDPRLRGAYQACYRVYGSWFAAVEAAGLQPRPRGGGSGPRRRLPPTRLLGQR